MQEVARAAGVSTATVSLALRGKPQIPEATRLRVCTAARELGYSPNPLVSALMATRRRARKTFQASLGFLTGHATPGGWREFTPAYGDLFRGIRKRATDLGYSVEEFWGREPGIDPARLRSILWTRGVQGILVAPQPIEDAKLPDLDWSDFSVLALGYSVREPEFHRISHDYFHGMALALTQCRAKGYRRIGLYLDRRVSTVTFNLWFAAYLAEQRTHVDAQPIEPLITEGPNAAALRSWLIRERPDCLVCLEPWRLEQDGLIPRGLPTASLNVDESPRPVPGVSRDFEVIGAAAVDRIVSLVQLNDRGIPTRPQTVLLQGLWVHDDLLIASRSLEPSGSPSKSIIAARKRKGA
jgi:DNA-binding LacI/PurR family transcriptional regulator